MKHVHVMNIRPDVITRTGVIQPYAIREIPPLAVARNSVQAFEQVARPSGPYVQSEPQPEEVAALAKRLATAMAQGVRPPAGTSPKLIQAARYIAEGKPFAIKSAGRTAQVKASPGYAGRKNTVVPAVRGRANTVVPAVRGRANTVVAAVRGGRSNTVVRSVRGKR